MVTFGDCEGQGEGRSSGNVLFLELDCGYTGVFI